MQIDEMHLDGNAAGGVLRDVFAHEMTAALAIRLLTIPEGAVAVLS